MRWWISLGLLCLIAGVPVWAEEPAPAGKDVSQVLTRAEAAVRALRDNPDLIALRKQHGIAEGAIVIARTYPFNPSWTNKVFADNGPESSGVTSHIAMEQRVSIDLELFGQGKHRRQVAEAGLSRTEFEIAASELALVIRTARAFDGVLYRQEKLRLLEETVALNEKAAAQIKALAGGKVRQADEILARTEVDAARALVGPGRGLYGTAWAELYTSLGSVDEHIVLRGRLDPPLPPLEEEALLREALERRPELHARQAAVGEAEARLRLEMSNRFGNPNFGPDFEYNETRVYFIGAQLVMPLPVLNTRRGEILQRTAERDRAILSLRALELQVRQQVQAALRRLQEAEKAAASYRTDLLPNLQKAVESLEQLFLANDPSVDVVKVLDVRRKLLKARDGYLDALWELSQARADLAAAVGEPSLAIVAESPPP